MLLPYCARELTLSLLTESFSLSLCLTLSVCLSFSLPTYHMHIFTFHLSLSFLSLALSHSLSLSLSLSLGQPTICTSLLSIFLYPFSLSLSVLSILSCIYLTFFLAAFFYLFLTIKELFLFSQKLERHSFQNLPMK
jgi:hypothetical protein